MKSAIIYTRSAAQNASKLTAQEKVCRAYAQANDVKVIQVFRDNGHSGAYRDRPGLKAALDYISEHRIQYVLTESPSRLARSISLALELQADIASRGAELVFVDEQSSNGLRRQRSADRAKGGVHPGAWTSAHFIRPELAQSVYRAAQQFIRAGLIRRQQLGRKFARERRAGT